MARLLEQQGHAFRVHPVREIGLLVDEEDYCRAFHREALAAEHYSLLSGWQFDSDVELLRGDDRARAEAPTEFQWTTDARLQFRFDSNHVERGCHLQKFVVIDGALTFLGGLDRCDDRWDDRRHRDDNPPRISRGEAHKPFHDIQAFVRGTENARSLAELSIERGLGRAVRELFATRKDRG